GAKMMIMASGALKPIGGHILLHSSATQMFLRKGKSLAPTVGRAKEHVMKLVDSPNCPESKASYKLDESGWTDI
ncbi:hypothetical protein BDR06DRAFT_873226, partial [Suillus hirtellus]